MIKKAIAFISQLQYAIADIAKPSRNRTRLLTQLESQQFQFGGWLRKEEISNLIKEVNMSIDLNDEKRYPY